MTTANAVKNTIVWFEIPSADFERAVKFYETVFAIDLRKGDFMVRLPLYSPMKSLQFPAASSKKINFVRDSADRSFTLM